MPRLLTSSLVAACLICPGAAHARPAATRAAIKPAVASPGSSATALAVGGSCTLKGKKLWGKVQVVQSFPDIKVQVVQSFPDIKVQRVTSFPDSCGKWQFVTSFPDLKIQFVTSFPDLKVQFVTSFPGLP